MAPNLVSEVTAQTPFEVHEKMAEMLFKVSSDILAIISLHLK